MIYLDTHVVVWLYAGRLDYFSEAIKELLREQDLFISPIVRLELQYLYNIDRIDANADTILADLSQRIGLTICPKPFNSIISHALQMEWTRDPFDRILVAHASIDNNILITKDRAIRDNYTLARW